MRVLGKFNVEPGRLARTLDRYPLERFAFKDSVKLECEMVEGRMIQIKDSFNGWWV